MGGMRATPRYRPVSRAHAEKRQFTDRKEAVALFRRVLREQAPDEQRVLNFYGVGGIGKSRLQQELRQLLRDESLALSVRIDFQPPGARRHDAALYQLRHCLRTEHDLDLPLFDIAYAVYWQRTNPNVPLAERDLPLVADSEILADLLAAGGATPVFGVVVHLVKGIDRLGDKAKRWRRVRDDPDLGGLDRLDTHELLDALNFFLARDLTHALKQRGERCVIFIDAHEALWEDVTARGARGDRDTWIRDLVLQTPGVLWVVGSRDGMTWAKAAPEWREPYLQQYAIGDLTVDDRTSFLGSCGIDGAVAKTISQASEGVPFYLNVSIDHWESIRQHREPLPQDFGHTQDEFLSRFVGHIPQPEEELLKVLSVSRSWDRDVFEFLVRRFNIAFPLSRWPEFCAYSFNRQTIGERWVMHQLMRGELLRHLDDEFLRTVHEAIFDYQQSRANDSQRSLAERALAFTEAVLHGLAAGRLTPDWFIDTADFFMYRGFWKAMWEATEEMEAGLRGAVGANEALVVLRQYVEAWIMRQEGRLGEARGAYSRLDLSAVAPWATGIRFQIANAMRESGEVAAAGTVYAQLWDARAESSRDVELDRLIGIQYADFHYVQGRFRDARAILTEIEGLDTSTCAKEVAEAKRILGHIERFSEREGRGLVLYRAAGALFEACDDLFGQAIIATNVAEALWPTDAAAAVRHAAEAVELNERLGARLEVGKAHVALAYARLVLGLVAEARRDADTAIAIQREVGYRTGEAQARLARACVRAVEGDRARAATDALEVGRGLGDLNAYPTLRLAAAQVADILGSDARTHIADLRASAEVQWLDDPVETRARIARLVARTLRP